MLGKTIGNCKITEKIGIGGFGTVYKGIQLSLNREVAIKALHPQWTEMPGFVEKFQSEAKILASLNHQNIVQVYDILQEQGAYFIIMEYVKGEVLKTLLERPSKLTLAQAISIAKDVGNALDYTHRKNIIHRDIKPANIMVTEEGKAKVMDFGIAKVLTEVTTSFTRVGTLTYAAPEQISGEEIDARADIYALAATLYHILTGQIPPANQPLTPPSSFNPDIPAALDKLIIKAMQKKKEDRYSAMEDFLSDLNAVAPDTTEEKTMFMENPGNNLCPLPFNLRNHKSVLTILLLAGGILGTILFILAISLFKKPSVPPYAIPRHSEVTDPRHSEAQPKNLDQNALTAISQASSKEKYEQGLEHTAREEWIEAIKDFEAALLIDKDNDHIYYELGYAYSQLTGRDKETKEYLKKAISLNPRNAMYRYTLGLVYLKNEQKEMAVSEWEKALQLDPENPTLQAVLKKYKP